MAPRSKRRKLSTDGAESTAVLDNETAEPDLSHIKKTRRQLFVRGLAPSTTSEDLTSHFSQTLPIKHAVVVTDPATKQCKGYGFVTFGDADQAQQATAELDRSTLLAKTIRVEVAKPRHREGEGASESPEAAPKRDSKKAQQPPPKLIVRNLPWSLNTDEKLERLFLSYGKVLHAVVPKAGAGKMRGFGIVLIRGRKNAEKALQGVNGKIIDGRTLAVDWAVDKDTWRQLQDAEGKNGIEGAEARHDDEDADEDASTDDEENFASDANSDQQMLNEEDVDNDQSQRNTEMLRPDFTDSTLFVRNLPFSCEDEDLEEHFNQFGPVRYARVVVDGSTGRSRGTGFVCFRTKADAKSCLMDAPRAQPTAIASKDKRGFEKASQTVLEDESLDASGRYTLDGRVLQVSQAVDKSEAVRLTEEGAARRNARDKDKRRLYLLSEGTIPSNSALYQTLSPSEISMREVSAKQRKALVESNPSLHLSLTRLSVRNIPRSLSSSGLKALAREAIVGFAKDVRDGRRQPLSREEISRGGDDMKEADRARREKGKGIVKQAKIVFEGREGQKVDESTGAGRSRGYGFIEYYTHRNALMGLRWLNGHAVDYAVQDQPASKKSSKINIQERKKRLIVEFALENAQVVKRRKDMETKQRQMRTTKLTMQTGEVSANEEGPKSTSAGVTADVKAASRARKKSEKLKKVQERRQRKQERRQGHQGQKMNGAG